MKKLYLLRGCPGCGKSSLVRKYGLERYTESTDAIRLEIAGTEVVNGINMISQSKNADVFRILHDRLEMRMQSGEPVIVDATNISQLGWYYKKALEYGYQVVIVDFKVSLEVLKQRNIGRGIHYVPEEVIESMYNRKKVSQILNPNVRVIAPSDFLSDWRSNK